LQHLILGADPQQHMSELQKAVLGGGCFWCTEAVFGELNGVVSVIPGYSGGKLPNPSYEQVCTDRTGHAEVVEVTFDPAVISYKDLLEVFFTIHDPTTLNRQGADTGRQYRSVIFYADDAQKREAEEAVRRFTAEKLFRDPIVTEITKLDAFYPAEDYHRNYFRNNPTQGYCRAVVAPKVAKFRAHWQNRLRAATA